MSAKWLVTLSLLMFLSSVVSKNDADFKKEILDAVQSLLKPKVYPKEDANPTGDEIVHPPSYDNKDTVKLNDTTVGVINTYIYNHLTANLSILGLSLPQLDPYYPLNFKLATGDDPTLGNFELDISNVEATGLRNLSLTSLHLNIFETPLNLNLNVSLSDVSLAGGQYLLDANFGDTFPLVGHGDFSLEIVGVNLYISLNLTSLDPFSLYFNDLDLSMEEFNSYFENLEESPQHGPIINEVLNFIMPSILNGISYPTLTGVLNELLG